MPTPKPTERWWRGISKVKLTVYRSDSTERGPLNPFLEISFVVGCVVISEWICPLIFGKNWLAGVIPACTVLAFIVTSQFVRGESLRDLGFRIDNFLAAAVLLLPPMVFASLVLVLIGWRFGGVRADSIRFDPSLLRISLWLFVWGLTQQYALQAFINRRAQKIWGAGFISLFFVASIFALLHLPNFWLMIVTFFGGTLWSFVYQRVPNLWAVALSHAIMTAVMALSVPYEALHGLRVGYNYFL
jgi:membrane protease YdiL (CAAX protease family)